MTMSLNNFLKNLSPKKFADDMKDKAKLQETLTKLGLASNLALIDFVEYMITNAKKLINEEKRNEGLLILRYIKALHPQVPESLHAHFYLTLADSFLLANDYEGAKKAASKAGSISNKLNDPKLQIKVYNLLFVISRTIGKDKAMGYLLKSKAIAEKNDLFENIVFCDVNIGLIHLFKNEINKAIEYCESSLNLINTHPYPDEKIIMPSDFFLQLFTDNPGLAVVEKNKTIVSNGVNVVLRAIKTLKSDYEGARRLTLLTSILKLSDTLLESTIGQIDNFVEGLKQNKRSTFYTAVANGIAGYKEYKLALVYFEKALSYTEYLSDVENRRVRKGYAYTLAQLLGVSMIYDLESSSQTTQLLKKLSLTLNSNSFLGSKGKRIEFRNAVSESDAAFALSRKLIEEKLLVSLKDKYTLSSNIISFFYKNSREDILENLEIFTINAITQEDEVQSILLAGTTIDEKDVKKKRKAFSGYQIIGHLIPESLKENKHIEDFDIRFINDLLRAPQRFKKIEILIPDSEINITYKPLFQ